MVDNSLHKVIFIHACMQNKDTKKAKFRHYIAILLY